MTDRQRIAQMSPEELQLLAQKLLRAGQSSSPDVAEASRAPTQAAVVCGPIPLTPIQKSYFDFAPVEPNYFVATVLQVCATRLSGSLIALALQHLLAHHDTLRLRFRRDQRGWHQQYSDSNEQQASFEIVDLAGASDAEQESGISQTARMHAKSLHISHGPLLRVVMFEFGPHRPQRLLLVIHHLLVDLLSLRIILEDLQTAHDQLALGGEVRLPATTAPFAAYAQKLQAYTRSAAAQGEAAYWNSLPWSAVEHLPVDHAFGENAASSVRTVIVSLSAEQTFVLTEEAPLVYRARINKVLLAALLMALTRWSGRRTIAIDVLEHGRNGSLSGLDLSRTVGWFSSEYPLVLMASAQVCSADILKAVGEQMRGVPNDGATYGALRYCSEVNPLGAIPLPEIRFNYQGKSAHQLVDDVPGESGDLVDTVAAHYGRQVRRHLLNVTSLVIGDRLRVCFEYSAALHEKKTIETLAAGFVECLQESIAHVEAARSDA